MKKRDRNKKGNNNNEDVSEEECLEHADKDKAMDAEEDIVSDDDMDQEEVVGARAEKPGKIEAQKKKGGRKRASRIKMIQQHPITWGVLVFYTDLHQREVRDRMFSAQCRLTQAVVQIDSFSKMCVQYCKIATEDKTVSYKT